MKLEKIIKENDKFEFELQKLLDISSNIENEDLRTRLIAQFIKCQEIKIKNKIYNIWKNIYMMKKVLLGIISGWVCGLFWFPNINK